jgi:hypothetical protein
MLNDREASGHDHTMALYPHLPAGTEEKHKTVMQDTVAGVKSEIRAQRFSKEVSDIPPISTCTVQREKHSRLLQGAVGNGRSSLGREIPAFVLMM